MTRSLTVRERNNYKKKGCVLNEIIIQIKASTRYSTSYHKASMKVVTSNAHIKVLSDELLIKTKITKTISACAASALKSI